MLVFAFDIFTVGAGAVSAVTAGDVAANAAVVCVF